MKYIKNKIIFLPLLIAACVSIFFLFISKEETIEKILKNKYYNYLPMEATQYLKKRYEETGELLLTEKNKEENIPYLNPDFVEYLTLSESEMEEIDVIPNETILDYVFYDNAESELPETFNLMSVDTDNDGEADKNFTTSMKNQGSLGLCWSYAIMENTETLLMMQKNETYTEGVTTILSPRHLDYVMSKDGIVEYENPYGSRKLGSGGTFSSAAKHLSLGLSYYDDTWEYDSFTKKEKLEYLDIFNPNKSLYEIDSTIQMPTMTPNNMDLTLEANVTKFNNYINTIKGYIMTYGGPYVGTYAPGYQCSASNVYNTSQRVIDVNSTCTRNGAHAMQIIGWDDNYEYKYCKNGNRNITWTTTCTEENTVEGKGVWILRNSWGEDSTNKYTYLTYKSNYVDYGFVTSLDSKENRKWDYIYNYSNKNITIKTGTENLIYDFILEENTNAKIIKLKFKNNSQNRTYQIYISESGNENDYELVDTISVLYPGIITVDFFEKNYNITNKTIIKVAGGSISYSDIAVFTSETSNNKYVKTNDFTYDEGEEIEEDGLYRIRMHAHTYNIQDGSELTYKLYDNQGNSINDIVVSKNTVVLNNANTKILLPSIKEKEYVTVETYLDDELLSTSKISSNLPEPELGSGTIEDPYVIMTPLELYYINYHMGKHFVLGTDLDLTYDTQNENGLFYNDGNGWESIGYSDNKVFFGSLDGYYNGVYHKIIGLKMNSSKGLIYSVGNNSYRDANIRNIIFEKAYVKGGPLLIYKINSDKGFETTIENIATIDCTFDDKSKMIAYNVESLGTVTIRSIFSNSTFKANSGNSSIIQDVRAEEIGSRVVISDIQILGEIQNKASNYYYFVNYIRGNVKISNVILNNNYYKTPYFLTGSYIDTYKPTLQNIYYLNDINLNYISTSEYTATNVTSKTNSELKNTSNYSSWTNFDTYWEIKTIDEIQRFPVLKFVPFEYTSFKNMKVTIGYSINIFDYLNNDSQAAKDISYENLTSDILSIDADGNITGLKLGTGEIKVISNYDGYENIISVEVIDAVEYIIEYTSNSGTGTMENTPFITNTKTKLSKNLFNKDGYLFDGWNTKEDGSGTAYNDEAEINISENLMLYAQWKPISYRIVYHSNNEKNITESQDFIYDTYTLLKSNNFINDGYVFVNWNTKEDGSGKTYYDKEKVNNLSNIDGDVINLYAQWSETYSYIINNYSLVDNYINKIEINTDVEQFKKNIKLNKAYSVTVDYKTIDNKNVLYTSSKTRIFKNSILFKELINVVSGDVNGDGKLNYLDYVGIYNHIQKTKHPELNKVKLENEYLISADMSGENTVNYLDYIYVYNKIKELKGGK